MTSQHFYRLIDMVLAVDCRRLGFSRKRGTTSLWFAPLQSGTLFYEVFKGPKNPYIPPLGGGFNVHCRLTPSFDSKVRYTFRMTFRTWNTFLTRISTRCGRSATG